MIVQTPAAFQSAIVRSGFKLLYNELMEDISCTTW